MRKRLRINRCRHLHIRFGDSYLDGRDRRADSIRHREFSTVESGDSTIARDPVHCASYSRRARDGRKGSPQSRTAGAGQRKGLSSGVNVSGVYVKREGFRNRYALTAGNDQYGWNVGRLLRIDRYDYSRIRTLKAISDYECDVVGLAGLGNAWGPSEDPCDLARTADFREARSKRAV